MPMTKMWKSCAGAALAACLIAAAPLNAANGNAPDIPDRMKGAERVVVATASTIHAAWKQNKFGDRLIVSQMLLNVEETLKGGGPSSTWIEVEGGTLDGYTLRVSDMPELKAGDRALFMLDGTDAPIQVPHLRGLGILKLDDQDRVAGTSIRLQDIRGAAKRAVQ
jgi:hypothetical protein